MVRGISYNLVLLCAVLAIEAVEAQPGPPAESRNSYIVQVNAEADPGQVGRAVAGRTRGRLVHVYSNAVRGFSIHLPPGLAKQAIEAESGVLLVEPDVAVYAVEQTLPSGVNRIDGELNNTANIDGIDDRVNVDIAIIDTGIDIDHPDLNVVGGRHFYSLFGLLGYEDDQYDDDNGHGSHCAGIAAAKDNDIGVVGVAPGARLWAVKVLDLNGSGYLSDVIAGVDWVTARASIIEVANMSLAATASSSIFRTAIQNSVGEGVVHMVAAGNDTKDVYGFDGVLGTSDDVIPASFPEAAAISAMVDLDGKPGGLISDPLAEYGVDDSFANFSNDSHSVVAGNPVTSSGKAIDLLMPGVDILSCYMNGGYAIGSGTSMASPHAAGLAALYIAANGRANDAAGVYAIRQALIDAGVAQEDDENGLVLQNDFDGNKENIGWAGSTQSESPTLSSVQISPQSATIQTGETQQYTATALYSDSSQADVTYQAVWACSNEVVASIDEYGLATGVTVGTATITAQYDGAISNDAALTVTAVQEPPTLLSILVEPATAQIAEGGSQQYTATAVYSDNSQTDVTDQAVWESSDTTVATINAYGLAIGNAEGTAMITATFGGLISNTATLTVTAPEPVILQSIDVEPVSAEIAVGGSQQFTATGTYEGGSTADITNSVNWTSSVPAIASVDSTGLASGLAQGTTEITAALDGVTSNTAALSVTPALDRVAYVTVNAMPLFTFRNWWVATAMVWVYEDGATVPGAKIEGIWSGVYNKKASNTTDTFGFISFETGWIREPGTVTFTVTKVVSPDGQEYVLDPPEPAGSTQGP